MNRLGAMLCDARARSADRGAVRAGREPGRVEPEPARGARGPRARRPVHGRARSGAHRHRALRRRRAAGDHALRGSRRRGFVRRVRVAGDAGGDRPSRREPHQQRGRFGARGPLRLSGRALRSRPRRSCLPARSPTETARAVRARCARPARPCSSATRSRPSRSTAGAAVGLAGDRRARGTSRSTRPYPLALLSPASPKTINTMFGEFDGPEAVVRVNPDDAAERGLEDGATVRVYNAQGEIELPMRVDADLRPRRRDHPEGPVVPGAAGRDDRQRARARHAVRPRRRRDLQRRARRDRSGAALTRTPADCDGSGRRRRRSARSSSSRATTVSTASGSTRPSRRRDRRRRRSSATARAGRDRAVARQLDEWFAGTRRTLLARRSCGPTTCRRSPAPCSRRSSNGCRGARRSPTASWPSSRAGRARRGPSAAIMAGEPGPVRGPVPPGDRGRRPDRRLRRRTRRGRAEALAARARRRAPRPTIPGGRESVAIPSNAMTEYRIEHDSMGEVRVPADAKWAAQTAARGRELPDLRTARSNGDSFGRSR